MSETFTKLFSSITESTVWGEPYHVRIVWVAMLAMSDQNGDVFSAVPGLARRANVTLEEAEQALACFLAPDVYSRTADHDGRRIEPIAGGWRLLNHAKYRQHRDPEARREQNREAQQRFRDKHKVSQGKPESAGISPSESDADQKKKPKSLVRKSAQDEDFELAWSLYPKRGGGNSKADALKAWTARRREKEPVQGMVDGVRRYAAFINATGRAGTEYVMQASRFFGPSEQYHEQWAIPAAVAAKQQPGKTMGGLLALEAMKHGNGNGLAAHGGHIGAAVAALPFAGSDPGGGGFAGHGDCVDAEFVEVGLAPAARHAADS